MGFYVNPDNGERKETWLAKNGKVVASPKFDAASPNALVCLVDNGPFTAAGVAYSQAELDAFSYNDGRKRKWYEVPKSLIVGTGNVQPTMKDTDFH